LPYRNLNNDRAAFKATRKFGEFLDEPG
jgi:hypothetical protein